MSWLDDFGALAGALGPSAPSSGYTSWNTRLGSAGFNFGSGGGSSFGSSSLVNWNDLGSGSLSQPFSSPAPKAAPAAPPERFDLRYPVRPYGAPPVAPQPKQSTQGDIFGSALGAIGDTAGSLNLANVVPWFMERVNVLADEFSKVPVVGPALSVAKVPLDAFANGVKAVSDAAAPILNAFPDMVKNGQLFDRADLYRQLVSGKAADFGMGPVSNPIGTALQLAHDLTPLGAVADWTAGGSLFDTTGNDIKATFNVSGEKSQVDRYQQMFLHAVDPQQRATAEQRLGMLRGAIDIPDSVKVAIERNPNVSDAELTKLLDNAPEGRQWSYQGGVPGLVLNMGTPLLFYLAEARAGGLAAKSAGALGAEAGGGLGTAIGAAGKATSIAAKLQTYSMAAGLGTTAVTTAMDAVARWQGNQAAIDWFDRVNRTTKFSDDPSVQLVTAFSVNPFDALKITKAGAKAVIGGGLHPVATAKGAVGRLVPGRATLSLGNGLGDISLSAETAGRMQRFVGADAPMIGMVRRMYNLHSDAEAQTFLDTYYTNKGQAFDEVLGVALEQHLDTLPKAERAVINAMHPDPVARTRFVAQTYIDSAMNLIEKDPQAVAKRWQERSWAHHDYPGRFSPEVAAANAQDFRTATARTYQMRSELDAVVGYREYLPPQGQALARSWIEGAAVDGKVAVEGANGIQDLIRQFPAMRKYWTGLITNEASVPVSTVERMIERAQADWQRVTHQNPVRARTGSDPILRPNSPTLSRDTAEALGTSVETLDAIDQGAPTASALDSVRRFAVDKLGQTPEQVAAMTSEEAVSAAQKYVADTTAPWRRAGESVAAAEKDMASLRSDLARLHALPKHVVQPDEIIRLERQYAALNTLVRASSDPIVPFVSEVATARPGALREGRDMALTELATRRAEATTQLNQLQDIHDAGAALAGDAWHTLFRRVEGQVEYSGNLPAMSAAMRRALHYPAGMGDYEAWSNLGNSLDRVEHLLTKAQRRAAHEVLDGGGWKHQSPAETIKAADQTTGLGRDAAVEEAARLWKERDAILAGTSEYALRRTADLHLPAQYVALADEMAAQGVERGIIQDPQFAKVTHPNNVARLEDALATPDTYPAARDIIEADPVLADRYAAFMLDRGMVGTPEVASMDLASGERVNFTYDALGDPAYGPALHDALIPAGFERPVPGVILPDGMWDKAILANDKPALEQLAQDFKADETPAPPVSTPARLAKQAAVNVPKRRPSVRYARRLAEADNSASPDATVMAAPGNRIGMDVLSVMNHGITGTQPATVDRVLELLRAIENGDARRAGIGDGLAAEAQRVANEVLDAAVKEAPRPATTGIFTRGIFPENEMTLAGEIEHLLKYDEANPLGTLQYGLKKRPKDAVVLEWSQVPGLAEELMTSRFQPYAERAGAAQVRQAYNYVFGGRSNEAIRAEAKVRFLERAAQDGIDGTTAAAIHDAWRTVAKESRSDVLRKLPSGVRHYVSGDNPLYADVHNLPNAKLDAIAHKTIDELHDSGKIDATDAYLQALHKVDYAALFRESTSFIRRGLADHGGRLGDDLARAYGMVAHNKAVTTSYYWFRFGLDVRFHAMNYFEAQFLYLGRAGLKKGEISQGQLGMTEQYLRNLASDPMSNTGYQFSQDRMAWAYRTFLKEQPEALRAKLSGLQAEDPAMMQQALEQLAIHDPQIQDLIRNADIQAAYDTGQIARGQALNREAGLARGGTAESGGAMKPNAPTGIEVIRARAAARKARIADIVAAGERPIEYARTDGGRTLIHLDPRREGMWQVTSIMPDGQPFGHIEADTFKQAITTAIDDHRNIVPAPAAAARAPVDPTKFLNELDAWHKKMLDAASIDENGALIDEALAQAYRESPELAQVLARLGDANKGLWDDIRQTFYGNPNRSRAERFLNSYLLYWPLSYQVKAAKWFSRVLFDEAGGIKTNAAGAYLFDQMAQTHQQLLATSPSYQDWFTKHKTLVFMAQMMFPLNFDETGVSLNPAMRSLFFGRAKAIWDIGPVWTFNHAVKPGLKEVYADLYPTLKDAPGYDGIYRALTGVPEPNLAP